MHKLCKLWLPAPKQRPWSPQTCPTALGPVARRRAMSAAPAAEGDRAKKALATLQAQFPAADMEGAAKKALAVLPKDPLTADLEGAAKKALAKLRQGQAELSSGDELLTSSSGPTLVNGTPANGQPANGEPKRRHRKSRSNGTRSHRSGAQSEASQLTLGHSGPAQASPELERRSHRSRPPGSSSKHSGATGSSSRRGKSRGRGGDDVAHGESLEQNEYRNARHALRHFTKAFQFEHGRAPTTEEDWHPMRRTRGIVRGGNTQFSQLTRPTSGLSPEKPKLPGAAEGLLGAAAPAAVHAQKTASLGPIGRLRASMRFWLSKPWVDAAVLVVVIAYGVFVFFDLGVGALATEAWRETWSKVIDAIFLLLFVIELAAKVLAFGPSYVTDSALNMIDASAIVVCAVLFLLSDITNVILATGADDDEAAEDSEKIAALLLLLRCIRVVRLAAVMVRSLNVTSTSITRAQTSHNGSMKNPLKAQRAATGYRGSTGAETWEIRRREACERPDADELGVPKETQRFLCDTASEDVVRLLTGEFQTLLTLFKKLDTSGDGSLQREEMIPGLRGLGLSEEVSEKFFAAMDVDNTGGVEVAELFRAGAYLRADGLEMRKRLNLLANSRKKPSTPTRTAPDGGAAPALKRRSKLKRLFRGLVPKKCTRLREKLLLSIRWWARERWDPSHELKATLMFLKPIKMAQARQKSLIQLAPPYLFKPGRIEVREHLNGSGAMLETRIEHLLFLLEVTLADVGEMSRKLQEIEIGQPKDALQERHEIAIYRTFLEGLCRALPAARLRIEPFANVVHYHTWHALCPGEGAERRVTVGSKRISIAFCTILGLRIVHLLMVNVPWTGESAYDRRLLCEQRFAVGTPTAELNFVLPKDYVPTTLSCDASDALFAMQGTAVIAPLLSLLMLPLARTLFRQNSNPTALQHLIKEPRVMLLLLQAIIWAGVNAVNMTRFVSGSESNPGLGWQTGLTRLPNPAACAAGDLAGVQCGQSRHCALPGRAPRLHLHPPVSVRVPSDGLPGCARAAHEVRAGDHSAAAAAGVHDRVLHVGPAVGDRAEGLGRHYDQLARDGHGRHGVGRRLNVVHLPARPDLYQAADHADGARAVRGGRQGAEEEAGRGRAALLPSGSAGGKVDEPPRPQGRTVGLKRRGLRDQQVLRLQR